MRALFLSNDASIPDVASQTRARMQAYAREIGELHVLMRSNRSRVTVDDAITIHEVQVSKIGSILLLPRHARDIIRKYNIDVVSAQDPFEHGFIALRAVSGTKAKLHVQVHTDFLSPWFTYGYTKQAFFNHIRLFLADRVLPRADGVRVVSARLKRSVMARYGARVTEPSVIPISIPRSEYKEQKLEPPFSFTLLVASRLESEKRVPDVLHALARVAKVYPNVGLIIAGSGSEERRLHHEVRALKIEDKVRFLGMRADLPELMRASHAFIQASSFEGYSRSVIEAALAGLPIISTDVGVINDVLMPHTHVLTFHVRDTEGLAACITSLIEDNALRTSLSLAAHQAVVEHLREFEAQPHLVAADLESVIKKV